MPGESSISFKVYIMQGREHTEVRRFEVDQGVVTNFDYIRERLQYIFPTIRGKTFKILWKDSEGDEVTISSDEEMMIALSELKSDLCKLIIRLPEEEVPSNNEVHIEIPFAMCPALADIEGTNNCSTCQKPMQGFRYKCLECLDFYQCTECEAKGTHSDHVMLRLTQNYPSLISMIPKGLHILRHLVKGSSKCIGKAAHDHFKRFDYGRGSFGEKCKRRYKRHGHSEKHSKYDKCGEKSEKCEENCQEKCQEKCQASQENADTYIYNEIDRLVKAFLNMFPAQSGCPMKQDSQNPKESQPQMETEESSQDEDMGCEILDAPPEPVKFSKDDSNPPEYNSGGKKDTESGALPSGSKTSPQIMAAVQRLTEMGFPNEGQWLAKILERFDGDISKALDHLTQDPK